VLALVETYKSVCQCLLQLQIAFKCKTLSWPIFGAIKIGFSYSMKATIFNRSEIETNKIRISL